MPHLVVFVPIEELERAEAFCASVIDGPLKGAVVSTKYAQAWSRLPKWARVRVSELNDAGIRNFAVLNIGGEQLLEAIGG